MRKSAADRRVIISIKNVLICHTGKSIITKSALPQLVPNWFSLKKAKMDHGRFQLQFFPFCITTTQGFVRSIWPRSGPISLTLFELPRLTIRVMNTPSWVESLSGLVLSAWLCLICCSDPGLDLSCGFYLLDWWVSLSRFFNSSSSKIECSEITNCLELVGGESLSFFVSKRLHHTQVSKERQLSLSLFMYDLMRTSSSCVSTTHQPKKKKKRIASKEKTRAWI